jgi:hypothetical protein
MELRVTEAQLRACGLRSLRHFNVYEHFGRQTYLSVVAAVVVKVTAVSA